MDIISYVEGKKAKKGARWTREELVGLEAQREYESLDHRLDMIFDLLEGSRIVKTIRISKDLNSEAALDYGNHVNTQIDKGNLILKKSGGNYTSGGYWESHVLESTDGFEKMLSLNKKTEETSKDKISIFYRTSVNSNLEERVYEPLGDDSKFKRYAQFKIILSSTNSAEGKEIEEDFSNEDDSEEEKSKEGYTPKANIFNPNALVSFGSDAKLANHIAATAYPQEKFREFYPNSKGFVYETRFPIDEFIGINGIGIKNKIYSGPGPQELIAGDLERGFYGEVPSSEIISGKELAELVGVTQGTSQFSDVNWLKWAYKGKTLFRPKKAIRSHISWDHLNEKNLVYGDRTIEVDGLQYKIRLMRGVSKEYETAEANPQKTAPNSEWNHLMLPIHEQAKDGSWAYPQYVEDDVPYWSTDYTDEDLQLSSGNGREVWCQEYYNSGYSSRVTRGGNGVSYADYHLSNTTNSSWGWAPVLELLSD